MLTPEAVKAMDAEQVHNAANALLIAQAKFNYPAHELGPLPRVPSEDPDGWLGLHSDDGSDYLRTWLDAMSALLHLSYEGSADELCWLLFGPSNPPEGNPHMVFVDTLASIDSAGGLCDELEEYAGKVRDEEEAAAVYGRPQGS